MPDEWIEKDGLLYYKNGLYIPENEALQTEIAQGCHDSLVAGHFGQEKTIEIVTRGFYWKRLTDCIRDYVRSCDECQHSKSPRHAKYGQHLELPYAAWSSISTDFITQLPESQGKTQIMVVVDRFTKMAHFIGLHENATQRMLRIPSFGKSGNLTDCRPKSHRTWTRSFPANFGNHCAKC